METQLWVDPSADVVTGIDALRIHPSQPYGVRYPIQDGYFNLNGGSIHDGGYCSREEVINDLTRIWQDVLHDKIGLSLKDLSQYSVMLIVPDRFSKREVGFIGRCHFLLFRAL
jgi:hypothetical protein